MPWDFVAFPPDLEPVVRERVAKQCRFAEAADPARYAIRGAPVTFYQNAWLAYLEPIRPEPGGARRYFLTRPRAKRDRIVPLANAPGSVDRVNARYKLNLTRENFVDYLSFYYAFTPQYHPMLARMPAGVTQFKVPRHADDLQFASIGATPTGAPCSDQCLARGAIWHYLDEATHTRVAPLRFKSRSASPFAVSGRLPVQFHHALFAADFKVPLTTGVPVQANPELLYQSNALVEPEVLSGPSLEVPKSIRRRELWQRLLAQVARMSALAGHRTLQVLWWLLVIAVVYVWACSALFSVFEWTGSNWVRSHYRWWASLLGVGDWPILGIGWTIAAILAYLWVIVLTTHRDKIFNWIFRLCPRRLERWVVRMLDHYVGKWDSSLTAQDTFRKRAWWSLAHLVVWTGYMVLAFASLEILLSLEIKQSPGTTILLAHTLLIQALLNVPFVAFALIQVFGLIEWLDPVAENILNYWVLAGFQAAMALVVFRGLYRVWVFSVEASPYTFFRRLRHNPGSRRR